MRSGKEKIRSETFKRRMRGRCKDINRAVYDQAGDYKEDKMGWE